MLRALPVLLLAVSALEGQTTTPPAWKEFRIGPATGHNVNVTPDGIRSDGVTLKTVISCAYDIPPVRIVAPGWLAEARYSITAVVPSGAKESYQRPCERNWSSAWN